MRGRIPHSGRGTGRTPVQGGVKDLLSFIYQKLEIECLGNISKALITFIIFN